MIGTLSTPAYQPPFQAQLSGYRGSSTSLAAMQRMARQGEADPEVRRWAVDTIRQVTPKDYLSELAAIFYRTCRDIRYTRDPAHTELVAHPLVTLEQRAADCDDIATLQRATIAAAGAAVGNQFDFTVVGFRANAGPDPFSHVFLRAQHPTTGQWLVLDPVAGPYTPAMLRRVRTARHVLV